MSIYVSPRGQKSVLDLLELELQVFMSHMWMLRTKFRSSARAAMLLTAELSFSAVYLQII